MERFWRNILELAFGCGNAERLLSAGELLKVCCRKFKAHPVSTIVYKHSARAADGICVTGSAVLPL